MTQLNHEAYVTLLKEDLEWLKSQPRSLERDHIELVLRAELNGRVTCSNCGYKHCMANPVLGFYCPSCRHRSEDCG